MRFSFYANVLLPEGQTEIEFTLTLFLLAFPYMAPFSQNLDFN